MAHFLNESSTESANTSAGTATASVFQSVLVTHVESPVLFYCRLLADEPAFGRLQAMIDAEVEANRVQLPSIHLDRGGGALGGANHPENLVVLVYSTIRDRWCRGRLLSYQANSADGTPINAKVCLIDHGSVEIVLWTGKYVRPSTGEIDAFNDGAGFCFACSLGNIEPIAEEECGRNKPTMMGSLAYLQWSSYAKYLLDQETKNRAFLLATLDDLFSAAAAAASSASLTCDLLPLAELDLLLDSSAGSYNCEVDNDNNDNLFGFSHRRQQGNCSSLSDYLVKANVARYVKHQLEGNSEGEEEDDEKENVFS